MFWNAFGIPYDLYSFLPWYMCILHIHTYTIIYYTYVHIAYWYGLIWIWQFYLWQQRYVSYPFNYFREHFSLQEKWFEGFPIRKKKIDFEMRKHCRRYFGLISKKSHEDVWNCGHISFQKSWRHMYCTVFVIISSLSGIGTCCILVFRNNM